MSGDPDVDATESDGTADDRDGPPDDRTGDGREDVDDSDDEVDDRRGDHYVYVVECADGTLYTGYTTDVQRRVREHDRGEGAKYTRGRTPVELRHFEALESRSAAMSREREIKSLSRSEKERLVGD